MTVDILDDQGTVIPPFSRSACIPVRGDSTRHQVRWSLPSVEALIGRTVRLRFAVTRGRLYSFWVSPWESGHSRGYPAAGGPEFAGAVDEPSSR